METQNRPLTGADRRFLRARAHSLDPVVQVGLRGGADSVIAEVDRALEAHELIKVRLPGDRAARRALAAELATRTRAHEVALVGGVLTLFRYQHDPERRQVELPRRGTKEQD